MASWPSGVKPLLTSDCEIAWSRLPSRNETRPAQGAHAGTSFLERRRFGWTPCRAGEPIGARIRNQPPLGKNPLVGAVIVFGVQPAASAAYDETTVSPLTVIDTPLAGAKSTASIPALSLSSLVADALGLKRRVDGPHPAGIRRPRPPRPG